MKTVILIVISLFVMFTAHSNPLFDKGLEAANKKEYALAVDYFQQVINQEKTNASAYYNLGCSLFEQKKYGEAIWAYEKTLQYQPNFPNTLRNLEICHFKLELPTYEPIHSGLFRTVNSFGSTNWSILAILFSFVVAFGIIVLKRNKILAAKRIAFLSIILGTSFCVASCFLAYKSYTDFHYSSSAIVIGKSIPTFLNYQGEKGAMNINEGIRLTNLQKAKGVYYSVVLPNGQELMISGEGWRKL